jgi:hypothetical protein
MGKADDMRRQRELRYEQDQREDAARRKLAAAAPVAKPAAEKIAPAPAAAEPEEPDDDVEASEATEGDESSTTPRTKLGRAPRKPAGGAASEEQGICSVCKKQRQLQNGLIANHQKGLGKACAGSRKPPA